MDDFAGLFEVVAGPPEFYAQVILTVIDHAPLLAAPRLTREAVRALHDCAPDAPGTLWGYSVGPDAVRFIVGLTNETDLDTFTERAKAHLARRLLAVIRRADDSSLDAVLRYNPVWGGAIYQVWQAGSHRTLFWTEYKLSNALYELRQSGLYAYISSGESV